jgi:hypothetical protein
MLLWGDVPMSNKNELVVKSNRLVEASYRLSLVEQRVVLLAIVNARETGRGLNALDFVPITAKDYAERFDADEKSAYAQIKEAGLTLYERGFVLHDTDPDSRKPRTIKARWVSAATYIDGAGTIQLRFSPEIVPYITRLEAEFTRYKLEKVAKMSSAYAIRLYELLMQWSSVGKREVDLEWLKKALTVNEEYERLDNFKKRVIDVALSQINEHSDLTANYAQRKTGRNVTHLIFTFAFKEEAPLQQALPPQALPPQSPSPQAPPPQAPPPQAPPPQAPLPQAPPPQAPPPQAPAQDAPADLRNSELFQRLRGHGISAKLAAAWIKQDEARVLATVEYVDARAKAGQIKGSAAGYLRTLFENGAEVGPSVFNVKVKTQADEAAEAMRRVWQQEAAARRAETEKFNRDWDVMGVALAWFKTLSDAEKQVLEAAFMAEANIFDVKNFQQIGTTYTGFRFFVRKIWKANAAKAGRDPLVPLDAIAGQP